MKPIRFSDALLLRRKRRTASVQHHQVNTLESLPTGINYEVEDN
jgi:hypothetical protein